MTRLTDEQQRAKWDKSGLKEACQRALKLGRTHQETDIQLFLDMLLEIERLESLLDSDSQAAEKSRVVLLEQSIAVVRPCERCAPLVAGILKEEP